MFTKTSDCLDIGNRRKVSDGHKTIPAVQFRVGSGRVMVVAFNLRSPKVRLTLEAMYLAADGKMTEEELAHLTLTTIPKLGANENALLIVLRTLRNMREGKQEGEMVLDIKVDVLSNIFGALKNEGCLSFSSGITMGNAEEVNDFEEVTKERLAQTHRKRMDALSTDQEFLGYEGGYMYPEDCFLNNGHLSLAYLNALSGNAYSSYKTLKQAYSEDEHFRENPEFFNKTHCQCGGELIIRVQNGEYTLMSCVNTYCYEKMAFSLADFSRAMGIDGLGESTFMNLAKSIALEKLATTGDITVDYTDLLKRTNIKYLGDHAGNKLEEFLDSIATYKGTVKELVSRMGLPYISSEASRILTTDLLRNKELTPPQLLKESRIKGKHDLKFIMNLWLYLDSVRYVVLELAKSVNLEVVQEIVIYITKGVRLEVDSGRVESYTKRQFEDLVNRVMEDSGVNDVRLKINGSLTHKCQALIADQGRDTGSCRTAENYGIPIMTSREFLKMLGGKSDG